MRVGAVIILLAASTAPALDLMSPQFSGEARVLTEHATVADDISVRVDLTVAIGPYQYREPDWASGVPEEFELRDVERIASSSMIVEDKNSITLVPPNVSYMLTLSALAPGEYALGPFELRADATDPNAEPLVATIEPITITVESILEGDTDLADIKDPFAPPPDYTKIALITAGSALALGVLIAGAVLVARRRPESVAAPPEPAHNVAFSEIDALLASDLIATRQWMRYFGELSAITRRYIERRFDLHAPTQTTEEFLRDPHMQHLFEPAHDRLLRSFLMQSDVVKFAEGATDAHQATEAASRIRTFVEETKREERPA